jgi:clan AA aspartic protease
MAKVKLTNHFDFDRARNGLQRHEDIRSIEIEGMVDTGAMSLVLPADAVRALGVPVERVQGFRLADGTRRELPVVSGVMLEILGRVMTCDAVVTPAGSTALIGQIPLEGLDLVVVPGTRQVMPNPAHPDGPLYDLLRAS